MKETFRILFLMSLITAVMTVVTGCSDGDEPSEEAILYDIVCLEKDSGEGSVFSVSKPGNDENIILTTPQRVDTRIVAVGERLLLMYVPQSGVAYQSGAVSVRGYGRIVNGELAVTEGAETAGWDRDPVYLLSAWRAGRYLNIHARLPYDENPRAFMLAMPETQVDGRYPDIYLVHALEADVTTFSRAYYASFDISQIIDDPDTEGFTLHLNNSNLRLDEIRFEK